MKASRLAASQLATIPSVKTERIDRIRPKASASGPVTRPIGMGRLLVRRMIASTSASYHMFNAPLAPAPTVIASRAAIDRMTFWTCGAISTPAIAV